MKRIIVILLSFFYCCNVFSQYNIATKKLNDLELKGEIESIKIKETIIKGPKDNLVRKNVLSDVEYKVVNSEKVVPIKHIEQGIVCNFKYNNSWQIVEIENKYLEKYNVSAGKKTYNYDKNGNLKYELSYDKNNNLIDSIDVLHDNDTVIKTFYNANNERFKCEKILYNKHNKELINIQEIGGYKTKLVYEYDSTGYKKISEKWYLDNKLVQSIRYNYNERGNLISKIDCDEKEKEGATTLYEYDLITNLVTSIKTSDNLTTYDYNFDVNDNWTVKYEYYDDYPVKVIEREIKYKE
ncbi:MAG: hypothetical protein FWG85_04990 [Bacteroidetes bacterium]|nr:hypothetical protein [Bacteroidota bacterium]